MKSRKLAMTEHRAPRAPPGFLDRIIGIKDKETSVLNNLPCFVILLILSCLPICHDHFHTDVLQRELVVNRVQQIEGAPFRHFIAA